MTVFIQGSGKMLGQLRTIDIITQNGETAPALAVTGDYKNPPVDTEALSGNVIDILNDTKPQRTIHSASMRTGWIRHDRGIELYFQDSADLRDRKTISFHMLPACGDALENEISEKLLRSDNLEKLFTAITLTGGPGQDRGRPPPSRSL